MRSRDSIPRMAMAGMAMLALLWLGLGTARALADQATDSDASPDAASILADQVRAQGHSCDKPVEAHKDPNLSMPDEKAWILTCSNATYSVRLRPGLAAQIEEISEGQ